ncbi:alpha/beta hydrolase [Myxococcus eversor]|uniref:alpha/beta hydrolase n=1 Tax=Myxococcus eversor TaxID=2709661 RepID=UPI0013D28F2C|nr:alpha/beta hydrolase-fold protein [Myxococcus eversor]
MIPFLTLALTATLSSVCTGDPAPPAGTELTVVKVHYPLSTGDVWMLKSSPGYEWMRDTEVADRSTATFCAYVPTTTAAVQVRAYRDEVASKGAMYPVSRGKTVHIYPYFSTDSGQLTTVFPAFHSNALDNDRTIWAWLPAGYSENPLRRHPVIYMHDGCNLFDAALSITGDEWEVDEAVDAGIAKGAVDEVIVIFVNRTGQRMAEYVPVTDPSYPDVPALGDLYVRMLVEELKPRIDATLRTRTDAASTGIIGSSLGGLISVHAALRHPQIFGRVGALSPSVFWGNRFIASSAAASPAPGASTRLYIDEGSQESNIYALALADAFRSVGYTDGTTLRYVNEAGGYHTEPSWARRMPGVLHYLFPGRSNTARAPSELSSEP